MYTALLSATVFLLGPCSVALASRAGDAGGHNPGEGDLGAVMCAPDIMHRCVGTTPLTSLLACLALDVRRVSSNAGPSIGEGGALPWHMLTPFVVSRNCMLSPWVLVPFPAVPKLW